MRDKTGLLGFAGFAMSFKCIKSVPVSDLEVVAFVYVSEGFGEKIEELDILNHELRSRATFNQDVHGRCDCCGHSVSYTCEVVHKPTLEGYYVGRTCAAKLQDLAHFRGFEGLSVALAERARSRRATHAWLKAHPEHVEILAWAQADSAHHIASDIARKLGRYGSISDGQVNLLYKLRQQQDDRAAAQAAEPKPTTPAPEGRVEVKGVVLSTKVTETDFGTSHKMLVRLEDHNKVWCSVPAYSHAKRGDKITFRATFERSRDDQHFAFGSRPKLVEIVSAEQPATAAA